MTDRNRTKNETGSTRKRMNNLSEEKRRLLEKMLEKEGASRPPGPTQGARVQKRESTATPAHGPEHSGAPEKNTAAPQQQGPSRSKTTDHGGGTDGNPPSGKSPGPSQLDGGPLSQAGFFYNRQDPTGQSEKTGRWGDSGQGDATGQWGPTGHQDATGQPGNTGQWGDTGRRRTAGPGGIKGVRGAAGPGVPPENRAPLSSPLVALQPLGLRPPFFCVHAILGSVFPYHNLALHLEKEQPFYGLQAQGLDGRSDPLATIEEMAAFYIESLRKVQPVGPYYLGGYSFGGWVAFEMAQQLLAAGEKIGFLAVFGTTAPISMVSPALMERIEYAMEYMADYKKFVTNSFQSDDYRMAGGAAPSGMPGQPDANDSPLHRVLEANCRAQQKYAPKAYDGRIDLFSTRELLELCFADPSMGWKAMCTEGRIHHVSGNHFSTFQEPHVRDLAAKLTRCLAAARRKISNP